MKRTLTFSITLLLISFVSIAQEATITPRLLYTQGKGVQQGKFEAGGVGFQFEGFKTPESKLGVVVTGDWQISGTETKRVDLNFNNNFGYTDVNYSSTMNKLTGGLVYVPLRGSFISPFVSLQGGVLWYRTKFYVNDPTNADYCRPETNRNVKTSFALAGTAESGLKFRLRRKDAMRQLYAQAGIGYLLGTKASYIKLGDEPAGENTLPYTSKFKMSNGQTHSHAIGTMYRTRTSQLVYSVGVSFEL